MATSVDQFNKEIKQKIPALELLGMEFVEFNSSRVRLRARFAPNKNHINTAFGGSLYLAATSACYGLFRAMTEDIQQNQAIIILKSGSIEYLKPVNGDFEVTAEADNANKLDRLIESVARVGHGKLELKSRVVYDNKICATFSGIFVLKKT